MSLNAAEISLILTELNLKDAFIRQIIQNSFDTICFNIFKNGMSKNILICLAAGSCRIHETFSEVPKNEKPLRFMQFLKAHIKGCRISECEQIGLERIVKIVFTRGDEKLLMFIRLWSGAANIIVTDESLKILDVFFRRPKRNEITGGTFILPEIRERNENEKAKYSIVRNFDEVKTKNGTFNEKVDKWYALHSQSLSLKVLREQAQKHYDTQRSRMENALLKLEEKRNSFLFAEQWKHQGDLILSFGHLIDNEKKILECTDYITNSVIRIPIDPKKNTHENAAIFYDKYKKAVSGLEELEIDISKLKSEILNIDLIYEKIQKEENPLRIEQMLRKQTKPKQQIIKKHPGLQYEISGWTILVGRTSTENDELLRHHTKGLDMWLHCRDFSGAFVFIKNRPGKTVPLDILLDAANLAVYFSKARKNGKANLFYTQVKHLRRAKNASKGTVLPTNEKNIYISLDKERLRKLGI
ncbi:MAG: fibronectin-binding domain-containing protein [Treponema sp.]|nr:fibronectin-binding domain-containing protein [Treponema sp.]